ncbi:MAG: alkaline phosphatase family protein [Clostridia bacterium]
MKNLKITVTIFSLFALALSFVLVGHINNILPYHIEKDGSVYNNQSPVIYENNDIIITQNQANFDYKKELIKGLKIIDDNGTKSIEDDIFVDVSNVKIKNQKFETSSIKRTIFELSVNDPKIYRLKTKFTRVIEVVNYDEFLLKKGIFLNNAQIPVTEIFNIVSNHMNKKGIKKNKAIVLGVDGMRADAIALLNEKIGIKRIAKTGGIYRAYNNGDTNYTQITITGPSWTSMLTGVWANVHGVVSNSTSKNENVPTIMTTIAKNGYNTSFIALWRPLIDYSLKGEIHSKFKPILTNSDKKSKEEVINRIESNDDFIFVVFDNVDGAGHSTAFSTGSSTYMSEIECANNYIEEILQKIENRTTYADEDWLILSTTDHGGVFNNHGGQSREESTSFIAINGAID